MHTLTLTQTRTNTYWQYNHQLKFSSYKPHKSMNPVYWPPAFSFTKQLLLLFYIFCIKVFRNISLLQYPLSTDCYPVPCPLKIYSHKYPPFHYFIASLPFYIRLICICIYSNIQSVAHQKIENQEKNIQSVSGVRESILKLNIRLWPH